MMLFASNSCCMVHMYINEICRTFKNITGVLQYLYHHQEATVLARWHLPRRLCGRPTKLTHSKPDMPAFSFNLHLCMKSLFGPQRHLMLEWCPLCKWTHAITHLPHMTVTGCRLTGTATGCSLRIANMFTKAQVTKHHIEACSSSAMRRATDD